MPYLNILPLVLFPIVLLADPTVPGEKKPITVPPPAGVIPDDPWYIDDAKTLELLTEKITGFAKSGKTLSNEKLKAKMKPAKVALNLAKPGDKRLSPEEVYQQVLPSVFVIGSIYTNKDNGEWVSGIYGTAWAASADGVLVTNWHVFEDLEPDEVFGAIDHKGNVYPLIDFLGGDKVADVAVVKIGASGLTPLPVAAGPAPVASWVGVLSHPADHFYVFTQGHVTRYSRYTNDDGERERWMGITAEYASGSSGAPVLNDRGAVVGMTALTLTLDSPPEEPKPEEKKDRRRLSRRIKAQDKPPPKDDPKAKPDPMPKEKPEVKPSNVQMIMKLAVPGPLIRETFRK